MKSNILITAIICVTCCEIIALLLGFNGTALRIVVGAILLLAGVASPTPKFMKGGNEHGRKQRK